MMNDALILSRIGKNIRKKRTDATLTVRQLSTMSELSISQISYMENGKHDMSVVSLIKVADALACEVGDLMP